MTVPSVAVGRGAWTNRGKDNGSRYYTYIAGKPIDGDQPARDTNYQAVHLGVKAIQRRINSYGGYSPAVVEDGTYGPETAEAVKWLQGRLGVGVDGVVGPTTARAMFKDLLLWYGGVYHVPASQLHGFVMLESGYDPGAVGVVSPADRGLNQINENAHPDVSDEEAFDPFFSIDYTAKRLGEARAKYSGKTVDLKTKCSVAQHNVPVAGDLWYRDGVPPVGPGPYTIYGKQWDGWPNIEKYVNYVLGHALDFKA